MTHITTVTDDLRAHVLQNNVNATDAMRRLSTYINTVRSSVGHDGKVFACMPSIINGWVRGEDVFTLAADIAENG